MQKKYLEPWMRVQIFDEETLTTDEWENDATIKSTIYDGSGEGTDGDDFWL